MKSAHDRVADLNSDPVRVLAVDDRPAYHHIYRNAFSSEYPTISYEGWVTHAEALNDQLPGGAEWRDFDLILLDLGADLGHPANPSAHTEWPGLDVASRIRDAAPFNNALPKPFIAMITNYFRHGALREQVRRNGCLDGFYDRNDAMADDGDYLRGIVAAGAVGEVYQNNRGWIVPPGSSSPDKIEDLLGRFQQGIDPMDALEAGIACMKAYGMTLSEFLNPPAEWTRTERDRILGPITQAVTTKSKPKYSGKRQGWSLTYPGVRDLYKHFFLTGDDDK